MLLQLVDWHGVDEPCRTVTRQSCTLDSWLDYRLRSLLKKEENNLNPVSKNMCHDVITTSDLKPQQHLIIFGR